jgi:alpha-beta hydrolase superfamily lysophospholipase
MLNGENSYECRLLRSADDVGLALHIWRTHRARGSLFYIHGIQSHGGWLFETGPQLAQRGIQVFALDRRGSGRSEGPRGDTPSLEHLLDDYLRGFQAAAALAGEEPLNGSDCTAFTAIGQSLGGSVLAGLVASGRLPVDRLIFCAPALGQMRAKLLPDQLRQLRAQTAADMELAPVGLADGDYTDIPRYLDFMRNDPLMLRTVTRRSRATFLALEDFYFGGRTPWPDIPVNLIIPSRDPIIRLAAAQKTLEAISARQPEITQFSTTLHYIEFSNERERYWDLLAQLVTSPRLEVVQ